MVKIKIKESDVVPIRIAYMSGVKVEALAKKYGVCNDAIRRIIHIKNYKKVL